MCPGVYFDHYLFVRSYQFKLEEVESFRYRAKDAWRAVTRIAVREARLKEIKQEIFNCQKLKASHSILCWKIFCLNLLFQGYFEDNPNDLQVLRHDKALHTVRIQEHLRDVPEYIVPPSLKSLAGITRKRGKRKREHYKPSESSTAKFQVNSIIMLKRFPLIIFIFCR